MNQTQRANNSIKSDSQAALYGKYHYKESLIDDIYESQTQRFTIQTSSSKALVSNNFQDNDSDVEKDNRSSNELIMLDSECQGNLEELTRETLDHLEKRQTNYVTLPQHFSRIKFTAAGDGVTVST
ncbi:hypothetical protein Tco_1192399 [Tanacetum coccineum]